MTKHTVTTKRAELVLSLVAEWMTKHGMGTMVCPEGRDLTYSGRHADDKSECDWQIGPCPTGPDAAYRGLGPELNMDWDGTPTILLEGGPEYWSSECCFWVQERLDAARVPLFVEPYASYALSIYPN